MNRYTYKPEHTWHWERALGPDVADIVALTKQYYETEIVGIHTPQELVLARNLTLAIVNQLYNQFSELLLVARDKTTNQLLAYTWATRGFRPSWSDDEECCIRMAHVDLKCSARDRITLVNQMLDWWELWCIDCAIPVICSTTNRNDQTAFLRIHQQRGYDVRGSFAYKRLIPIT